MKIMKPVKYDFSDVQTEFANIIADLGAQLANERAAKKAIVKYAESLEKKIEELEKKNAE